MRTVVAWVGVIVSIVVLVRICCTPDAKANFKADHFKSLIKAIVPMIAFLVIVYFVLSHVGK